MAVFAAFEAAAATRRRRGGEEEDEERRFEGDEVDEAATATTTLDRSRGERFVAAALAAATARLVSHIHK